MEEHYLSQNESKIYELISQGEQPLELKKKWYFSSSSLYGIIKRLIDMGFVEKRQHKKKTKYHAIPKEYAIMDNEYALYRLRHQSEDEGPPIEPYPNLIVTPEKRKQIMDNYYLGTSKLVELVKLPRYVINRELINMGNDKES